MSAAWSHAPLGGGQGLRSDAASAVVILLVVLHLLLESDPPDAVELHHRWDQLTQRRLALEADVHDHALLAVVRDATGVLDRAGEAHGGGCGEHVAQHSGSIGVEDRKSVV